VLALALAVVLGVFNRYAGAFGQATNGFAEVDPFEFLHETKDIAAFMTSKAVKNLALRMNIEAGGLLFVEWAESDEVRPRPLEREIGTDDFDDVTGGTDLVENRLRKQATHGARLVRHQ
jgi:hypothetical protein